MLYLHGARKEGGVLPISCGSTYRIVYTFRPSVSTPRLVELCLLIGLGVRRTPWRRRRWRRIVWDVYLSTHHFGLKFGWERFTHVTIIGSAIPRVVVVVIVGVCIILLLPYLDCSTTSLRFRGRHGTVYLMAAFCRLEAAVRASEVHKKHVWHYNLQPPDMCMHHAPLEDEKASSQLVVPAS